MPRAVAFDLWETLITNTEELEQRQMSLRKERVASILARIGWEHNLGALDLAYRGSWNRCYELYWSRDLDIPVMTQIQHFVEGLGLSFDGISDQVRDELSYAYCEAAVEVPPAVIDGALETIAHLKENHHIGLISNTGRTPGFAIRRILEANGLGSAIDVMVFSDEHGECKPRRSIFERLIAGLACDPTEVVFVGDNLYTDVWGSKQMGMRGVHFNPEVRGMAIGDGGPPELEVAPDAVIQRLEELPPIVDGWKR